MSPVLLVLNKYIKAFLKKGKYRSVESKYFEWKRELQESWRLILMKGLSQSWDQHMNNLHLYYLQDITR